MDIDEYCRERYRVAYKHAWQPRLKHIYRGEQVGRQRLRHVMPFLTPCDSARGPPFALERLSVRRDEDGRIARVRYVLPPHEAANWVGPGRCPIREILTHLGEPLEPPPVSPARGPPTDWGELVRAHAERKAIQASPDELLVIDIHLL